MHFINKLLMIIEILQKLGGHVHESLWSNEPFQRLFLKVFLVQIILSVAIGDEMADWKASLTEDLMIGRSRVTMAKGISNFSSSEI